MDRRGSRNSRTLSDKSLGDVIMDCCRKRLSQCQCSSTSTEEDIRFTGSLYSIEDLAITSRAMQLISTPNALSCLFTEINYEKVQKEFTRFLDFIVGRPQRERSELESLVLPATIHIYALLMCSEFGVNGARNFINENESLLSQIGNYTEILDSLMLFNTFGEMKESSQFQCYIERKIIIEMSTSVFTTLQEFLRCSKIELHDSVLMSIFNFNVYFKNSDLSYKPKGDNQNEPGTSNDTRNDSKKGNRGKSGKSSDSCNVSKKDNRNKPGKSSDSCYDSKKDNRRKSGKSNDSCTVPKKGNQRKSGKSSDSCYDSKKNNRRKPGKSRGRYKKYETDTEEEEEEAQEHLNLDELEISRIIIRSKKPENSFLNSIQSVKKDSVNDEISQSALFKRKLRSSTLNPANIKPTRLRNVPSRSAKSKGKEVKVDPIPKKDIPKDQQDHPIASFTSIDFNCLMTELSFATGNNLIYTAAIKEPLQEDIKVVKFFQEKKVTMQTLHHEETHLKATRNPEPGPIRVVKYLPGNPSNLLASCSSKIRLFDTRTYTFLSAYNIHHSTIYDIDIDPTCQYFAVAFHNLSAFVYTFSCSTVLVKLSGHENAVVVVKFHPNAVYIATGCTDCSVRLFEVESGDCVRLFPGHIFTITNLDFSFDGLLLASADYSGMVYVWDIKECRIISKKAIRVSEEVINSITGLCFHKNCRILAAANEKGEAIFWDVENPDNKNVIRSLKKPVKICHPKDERWVLAYIIQNESAELGGVTRTLY